MTFKIVRQDITKLKVDAIVNAANKGLKMGGGVCGAIFQAAGPERLQAACDRLGPIEVGQAVITEGFDLPAKYIIHTVGPVYKDGQEGEDKLLKAAYLNSLKLAWKEGCRSIAFPLISSGIFGYPKAEALEIARKTIQSFIYQHDMEVILAVFDKSAFKISESLLGRVESYIDQHYVDRQKKESRILLDEESQILYQLVKLEEPSLKQKTLEEREASLEDLVGNLDESFSDLVLRLIDKKGKTDVEVYKKANIDRKLFSKIRTGKNYNPSKRTVLALAIGMELSLKEAKELLERAGYALSPAVKFDVIVEYFIINASYDIYQINEVLFKYDQPLLG